MSAPHTKQQIKKTIDELLSLIEDYSSVYRRTVVAEKVRIHPSAKVTDPKVRETLIEHVGILPIVASHLYPKMPNPNNIDLGRVLIIFSVHDLGETVTGDKIDYQKTEEEHLTELNSAINKADDMYAQYLLELNDLETEDSKYANSIDKILPHLLELTLPDGVYSSLMKENNFTISDVRKRKVHFVWNPFLEELFSEVLYRLDRKI